MSTSKRKRNTSKWIALGVRWSNELPVLMIPAEIRAQAMYMYHAGFAWSRADENLTDGHVPTAILQLLLAGMPIDTDACIDALATVGMVERTAEGFQILEYAEWAETRAQVQNRGETAQVNGMKGGRPPKNPTATQPSTDMGTDPEPSPNPEGTQQEPSPVSEAVGLVQTAISSTNTNRTPAELNALAAKVDARLKVTPGLDRGMVLTAIEKSMAAKTPASYFPGTLDGMIRDQAEKGSVSNNVHNLPARDNRGVA